MNSLKCQSCGEIVHDPVVLTACPGCKITGSMRAYGIPDIIDAIRADLREAREAEAALMAELRGDIRACHAAIDAIGAPL